MAIVFFSGKIKWGEADKKHSTLEFNIKARPKAKVDKKKKTILLKG